jgi:hypothetical protein
MASYKAHMAFGILTGIVWSIIIALFSIIAFWLIPIVFIITVIGAFLPDLDSDSGVPMRILLQFLSLASAIIFLFYVYKLDVKNLYLIVGWSIFIIFFVYYGLGGILKKMTRHRGIFHSVPAAILSVLISLSIVNFFNIPSVTKIIVSLSVGLGYFSHLLLDEMNSVVNLEGVPFFPKKSLGSALKLFSKNKIVSSLVYLAVIVLLWSNWETFVEAFSEIKLIIFN